MNRKVVIAVIFVAVFLGLYVGLDLGRYFTFAAISEFRVEAQALFADSPWRTAGIFFAIYVVSTALSFPGATVLTVLAGAIFGVVQGTILVSFASTLGATLAMLLARFLFRDAVHKRFSSQVERVDAGMRDEGAFYLFALRLVPIFPFFAVNLAMALTKARAVTFAWVSQLGMLPGTIVFVNAGTELAQLQSLDGILAPGFVLSFTALGLLPFVSRRVLDRVRTRRVQRDFPKPKRFDRNLIVIGAGAAGLVSAYIAATVRAKVTLVERHRMGGDCLNTGCVPSKALIRAAKAVHEAQTARRFGVHVELPRVEFAEVMRHLQQSIKTIEPHDSVERYEGLGVECRQGNARIVSPWCVEIDGEPLTTRSIIIAAGARPAVPPILGIEDVDYLTSDTLWDLQELPPRLVVLGGGPIGCELAQSFARLGSSVTVVEMAERVLSREDPRASALVADALKADGVTLQLGARANLVSGNGRAGTLSYARGDESGTVEFDALLVAVGRAPNVTGYGLEELGIDTAAGGVVATNQYLQTLHPNILACGDVAGPFQFTHVASHQAWYAAVNALFGDLRRFAADYRVIPRVTYTDPEVASVGLTEAGAIAEGRDVEVTEYELDDLDRAIVDGNGRGFVRVVTLTGTDRILGATIAGASAGELIAECTLAMRHGLGLKKLLGTIHAYPTMMEANRFAAGNWSKAHAPGRLLDWLERYHRWRRT